MAVPETQARAGLLVPFVTAYGEGA
jgi:hypothetical protein